MKKPWARLLLLTSVLGAWVALLFGYSVMYNRAGKGQVEYVLSTLRTAHEKNGAFPEVIAKGTRVLGFLPGPELFYWSKGSDCVVGFSQWPFGPKSLKNCSGGDWYYEG